jgi:dihydroorotate dehydrogenase
MTLRERLSLATLHRFDPETAHALAIKALTAGLTPKSAPFTSQRLQTTIAGIALPNPIGLAAGFDKNAVALSPLLQSGFGFIEIGAVTPRPQPGNPKPRLFRLTQDRAAINRFGFNNDGMDAVAARLAQPRAGGSLGINLGANKDSADKARDFADVLKATAPHVDFATINVSSPNTEKLRDLQGSDALKAVLDTVMSQNAALPTQRPIFLKVAPDLTEPQIDEIADAALNAGIAGLIATNTTLSRNDLQSPHAKETGGLSGAPLRPLATRILAHFAMRLENKLPIIGVGGISTPQDVIEKIEAGASAVQLYTAMIYSGLSLADRLAKHLDTYLIQNDLNVTSLRGRRIAELATPLDQP